jgi:hypothetical protein
MTPSLCETCARMRAVVTPRGSRFLLCQLSAADPAYPKYPPQPVVRCAGHVPAALGIGDPVGQTGPPDTVPVPEP